MFYCDRCDREFNSLGRDASGNGCCPFCGNRNLHIVFDNEDQEATPCE